VVWLIAFCLVCPTTCASAAASKRKQRNGRPAPPTGEEGGRRPSVEAKTVDVCGLQQALVRQRQLIEEAQRAKPGEV